MLALFFSPSTHTLTFVCGLKVLQDYIRKEKTSVLRWCSERLCSGSEDPAYILSYLNLLVPATDNFVDANLHHILPTVFYRSALQGIKKPLDALSGLHRARTKNLVYEFFPQIYAHIVMHSDSGQMERCMKYVKQVTGVELGVLITSNRLRVIEELLVIMNKNRYSSIDVLNISKTIRSMIYRVFHT